MVMCLSLRAELWGSGQEDHLPCVSVPSIIFYFEGNIITFKFIFMLYIAAALALLDQPGVDAETIVRKSMKIAGDICVYTNHNLLLEKLEPKAPAGDATTTPTPTTTITA